MKPANRTGWIGKENFAEANTSDRWYRFEDWLVAFRAAMNFGKLTVLPFRSPTDQAAATLVGERGTRTVAQNKHTAFRAPLTTYGVSSFDEQIYPANEDGFNYETAYQQGGEIFYGFLYYHNPNRDIRDPANQASWGPGYLDALMGGNQELFRGSIPLDYMPDVMEAAPWERDGLTGTD